MAINLGAAFVDIVPSTGKLADDLKSQMGAPIAASGEAAAKGFSSRFVSGITTGVIGPLNSLGGKIVDAVGSTVKVGFAAIGATAGLSLWGGLNRVLDTEDAQVQMKRMGLSIKEVDNLLGQVDQTFQGTPFANPDGFNISSQLYASGVELGKIPGVLGSIADLSAHANQPIGMMGDLFTKVAAQGKVTGVELMQLGRAGVPIAQIAAGLGMTVNEMQALTSAGGFTADMFYDAVAGAEMFEGAAKAAGDTTRGAWSNVMTAFKTTADKFLTPFFGENGHVVTGLKSVREGIRSVYPVAQQAGESLAAWLVPQIEKLGTVLMDRVVPAFQTVGGFITDHSDQIWELAGIVGPAVGIVAGLATSINLLARAFGLMQAVTPIGLLVLLSSGLVYAYQNSEAFRETVNRLVTSFMGFAGPVIDTVIGGISRIVDVFQSGETFGESFGLVIDEVGGIFASIATRLVDSWPAIKNTIASTARKIGDWVYENVPPIVDRLLMWGKAFIEWVVPMIPPLLRELGKLLSALGEWVIDEGLPLIARTLLDWGGAFIAWVGPHVPGMLKALGGLLWDLATWVVKDAVPKIVTALGEWANAFLDWVIPAGAGLLLTFGIWLITDAIPWFAALPGKLALAILSKVGDIFDAGLKAGAEFMKGVQRSIQNTAINLNPMNWGIKGAKSLWDTVAGRADGGAVSARTPYIVGERGPELMVPGMSGTVIPNHKLSVVNDGATEASASLAPLLAALLVEFQELKREVKRNAERANLQARIA